jgi:hypothetical protein
MSVGWTSGDPGTLPSRMRPTAAFWIVLVMLCGCGEITRSELLGKYVADYSSDDTIEVLNDGTYVHRFRGEDGAGATLREERGRWEYEKFRGEPMMTFTDFVQSSPEDPLPKRQGLWGVRPERRTLRWSIRLVVNRDLDRYYVKM